MILALRQRHRHVFMALAIFLPTAFALGIAVRKPVPAVTVLPAGLAAMPHKFDSVAWERAELFTKVPVQVRLLREQANSGHYGIEFFPAKNFVKPDLIVYWAAGTPTTTNMVPPTAILLGSFSSAPLLLPIEAEKSDGALVLFSLADGEITDVSKTFSLRTMAGGTR